MNKTKTYPDSAPLRASAHPDLTVMDKDFFKRRPLSWSAISSFEWDPEQWYKRYILNEVQPMTPAMEFGKEIGTKIELDPTFMSYVPRESKMEHEFKVVFNGIPLVGYADTFDDLYHDKITEYKTGKFWDQEKVDKHGQITMYCLMNFITNKVVPEDTRIELVWMPTQEKGDFSVGFVEPIEDTIKIFQTERTMQDIVEFGARINKTVEEMQTRLLHPPREPTTGGSALS